MKSLGQPSQYQADDLVVIGHLGKTHGLRGEIRCHPETDFPERFLDTDAVEIFNSGRPPRRVTIEYARLHKDVVLLKFVGVQDVDQAAQLRGFSVGVGPDEVVGLDEGEYYHYQLEGLAVEDPDGVPVGTLRQVMANAAHEIYVIARDGEEILIPAVDEYILSIDLDERRMRVRLPVYADDSD